MMPAIAPGPEDGADDRDETNEVRCREFLKETLIK